MSRTRNVTMPGVPEEGRVWSVPEMDSSHAYSGRAPRATKLTHWLVPLRQATEVVCWPPARGPTMRDLVAIPLELVVAVGEPVGLMLLPVCQATV